MQQNTYTRRYCRQTLSSDYLCTYTTTLPYLSPSPRYYFGPVEKLLRKETTLRDEKLQVHAVAGQGDGVNGQGPPEDDHVEEEMGTGIVALLKHVKESRRRAAERGGGGVDSSSVDPSREHSGMAPPVMKEWALYRNEDQVGCACVKDLGGPRKWWASKEKSYPTLAKLSGKYLAVQGSSAPLERLFSVGGAAISEKRKNMGGETAADIIFLHENMKNKKLW